MSGWLILGQGQIGHRLADRIRLSGSSVATSDRTGWQDAVSTHRGPLLLSLNRGSESVEVATFVRDVIPAGSLGPFVDLTTQSTTTVDRTRDALEFAGTDFLAGGLTGGARNVEKGSAVMVLGPGPVPDEIAPALAYVGRVIEFPSAKAAVIAKLIHNYVLLATSDALAIATSVGRELDCLDEIVDTIATGPAGRPCMDQSLIRDLQGRGQSSYLARLVTKDIEQILESADALGPIDDGLLLRLHSVMRDGGDEPYTFRMAGRSTSFKAREL